MVRNHYHRWRQQCVAHTRKNVLGAIPLLSIPTGALEDDSPHQLAISSEMQKTRNIAVGCPVYKSSASVRFAAFYAPLVLRAAIHLLFC